MAFCVLFSSYASAQIKVKWDCYLPDGSIDCATLANAYFQATPHIENTDEQEDIKIEIRSAELSNRRRYEVQVFTPESHLELAQEISNHRSVDQTLASVIALLHRGTIPFLSIQGPGRMEGGMFQLQFDEAETLTTQDEELSAWYLRPSIEGQLLRAGLTMVGVYGELEANHSTDAFRFRLNIGGGYRYANLSLPNDESLRGGFLYGGGSIAVVRSLPKGMSIAALGNAKRQPQNNLTFRVEGGLGVEWLSHPFLRADSSNLGVRYRFYVVQDQYVTATQMDMNRQTYFRHFASLFGQLHSDSTDIALDLGVGCPLLHPELWRVYGNASVTLRITDGIEMGLSGELTVRGGAIHQPADSSRLSPVATLLAGSDFGRLNYNLKLSLSYTFGNGLLRSQDRRWR